VAQMGSKCKKRKHEFPPDEHLIINSNFLKKEINRKMVKEFPLD